MRTGLFQGCFPPDISLQDCIKITAKHGFDGFELTLEDPSPLIPEAINETTEEIFGIGDSVGMSLAREGALDFNSSDPEITSLGQLASKNGIRIHSIATMMHFFYSLSSPIPQVRDKGIQLAVRMLEVASLLGADTILLVPGIVAPSIGYKEVYERSLAIIKDLETEARRLQITIAIENVWNRFLLSPLEMARYIDEIASPYVGVYFDTANIVRYGYPEDWIQILGSRVKAVHFKDFRKDVDNIRGFTHLLYGDINWSAVSKSLEDIKYDGYVTVEVPPFKAFPEYAIKSARDSLNLILGGALE